MSRLVTVHSDGTGHGTVILDENGAQLANVAELNFSVEANGVARGNIEVLGIKANVSNVAIEEVTFVCPLCQDRSEHTCDTQLGGGSPVMQHASLQFGAPAFPGQVAQLIQLAAPTVNYTPCGDTFQDTNATCFCYVNNSLPHDRHIDVLQGVIWENSATGQMISSMKRS